MTPKEKAIDAMRSMGVVSSVIIALGQDRRCESCGRYLSYASMRQEDQIGLVTEATGCYVWHIVSIDFSISSGCQNGTIDTYLLVSDDKDIVDNRDGTFTVWACLVNAQHPELRDVTQIRIRNRCNAIERVF